MKMWKKFAAALLVAAMALTMLTACGGSGTAAIVRDTEQEKTTVALAQKGAKSMGLTLEEDETATNAAVAALPSAVALYDAAVKKDTAAYYKAAVDGKNAVMGVLNAVNKKGFPIIDAYPGEITEEVMKIELDAVKQQIANGSIVVDYTPTKVGVAVTKKGDYSIFVVVITE